MSNWTIRKEAQTPSSDTSITAKEPPDLIARLEAATEGSRELDYELWCFACGYEYRGLHANGWCFVFERSNGYVGKQDMGWPTTPKYSSSLDAALPGENIVNVMRRDNDWMAYNYVGEHVEDAGTVGIGKTEALARRIAALKARS